MNRTFAILLYVSTSYAYGAKTASIQGSQQNLAAPTDLKVVIKQNKKQWCEYNEIHVSN